VDIQSALTFKVQGIYVAFAPHFNVSAYGGCQDEALNNLTDEIRDHRKTAKVTGYERRRDAVR
jgi:hypothetical protein